jgi:hypothetical protein
MASTAIVTIAVDYGRKELLLGDFDDGATLVKAATAAYTVRKLGRVTVRTLRHDRANQEIMRAAGRSAALGVTSFWIRHGELSNFSL